MVEHHASVEVHAPVQQVYTLFTHFNDFPKFMHFVKEVTYYDEQRSHWVVQIAGQHEWDAINDGWIPHQQIGWRSINGLTNTGKVTFQGLGSDRTMVDVYLSYEPPYGPLGKAANALGVNEHFDTALQQDLQHFAHMVEQIPPGVDDPMWSHYLFHQESALAGGVATARQHDSMAQDPMMSAQALQERDRAVHEQQQAQQQAIQQQQMRREQEQQMQQRAAREHEHALKQQQRRDEQTKAQQEEQATDAQISDLDMADAPPALGGRSAATSGNALGDMDAQTKRFPGHEQDPMTARYIFREQEQGFTTNPEVHTKEDVSPWHRSIRGNPNAETSDTEP